MRKLITISIAFVCCVPVLGQSTSEPCQWVQNREFSDSDDVDQSGAPDPGQVLFFDCFGGSMDHMLRDIVEPNNVSLQVDALANRNDFLFIPFINDQVEMIFSVEDDRNIYFEREQSGRHGLWTPNVARQDVDALEVWGDSNSDHHSFEGDPGGVALFYTGTLPITNVTSADLLTGIQSLGVGMDLDPDDIDLDASMRWNEIDGGLLAFSVAPVVDDTGDTILDGGEIFVLDLNTLTAEYLLHGGHLWDTDFDVMATFGVLNENVNAIEAVAPIPSPPTVLLFAAFVPLTRRTRTGSPH